MLPILAALLQQLGSRSIYAEQASHFLVQIELALAVSAILLVIQCIRQRSWQRAWPIIAVTTALLLINLDQMTWLLDKPPLPVHQSAKLSIMQINVNSANRQFGKITDLFEKHDPDVICLQELSYDLDQFLTKKITDRYRSFHAIPRDDNYGIAVYSKIPVPAFSVDSSYGMPPLPSITARLPSIRARLLLEGEPVNLICTHTMPPMNIICQTWRNSHLKALAESTSKSSHPVIVAGDLNASPWCYSFKKMLREGSLRDSGRGYGIQPTWPTGLLLLGIPLDHVLTSNSIVTTKRIVCEDIGSDHFPVFVELELPARKDQQGN